MKVGDSTKLHEVFLVISLNPRLGKPISKARLVRTWLIILGHQDQKRDPSIRLLRPENNEENESGRHLERENWFVLTILMHSLKKKTVDLLSKYRSG